MYNRKVSRLNSIANYFKKKEYRALYHPYIESIEVQSKKEKKI